MRRACLVMLTVAAAAGCRAADTKRAETSRRDTSVANAAPSDAVSGDSASVGTSQYPDSSGAAAHGTTQAAWTVTDSGAGVLRIGMTRGQLALDLHATPPKHTRADSGCAYLAVAGIPAGMRTMWVAATLARIDIGAPKIATDRGAKIGDREARIDSLYRGRVTTMPAKYDPHAKYLVIHPPPSADSTRRIVFETDSTTRVTRYRVGREPEVEWVEGCS